MGINLSKFVVHWPVRLTQLIDLNAKTPASIEINVVQNSISAAVMIRWWPDASWDFKPHLQVSLVRLGFLSVITNKKSLAESSVTTQSLTPRNKAP